MILYLFRYIFHIVPGETPIDWIGSSKKDLLFFPEEVVKVVGYALGLAQLGGKHPHAKPRKGEGRSCGKDEMT